MTAPLEQGGCMGFSQHKSVRFGNLFFQFQSFADCQ